MEQLRDRILDAIDQGYVIEYGTNRRILLNDTDGIDVLGNILESSAISPNRQLYGGLHNMGHVVIAFVSCKTSERTRVKTNKHLTYCSIILQGSRS